MRWPGSIRGRLLLGVSLVQLMVGTVATVLVVRHERVQSYRAFDASLAEHVAGIQAAIEVPDEANQTYQVHRELVRLPEHALYQVKDATGAALAGTQGWPGPRTTPAGARGTVEFRWEGRRYRGIVLKDVSLPNPEPDEQVMPPPLTLTYAARTGGVEEHLDHIAWASALVCLGMLLLSCAAGAWVVELALRPLGEVAARATRIHSRQWSFEAEAGSGRVRELVPLEEALTGLVERLRRAFERERQFFADAGHEMKTGVAVVQSTLQLALQRERSAEEYREGLGRALEDTGRLHGLVRGMLELERAEGPADSEGTAACEVNSVLNTVERRLAPLMAASGVRFEREADQAEVWVGAAGEDLQVVLSNLVENAVHYSPEGGVVRVSVTAGGGQCAIAVEDAGCGIAEEAVPHIFERFYRSDPSRARASGGNGLGLSIVRAMVERARGTVVVESRVGVGSRFTVRLPLR